MSAQRETAFYLWAYYTDTFKNLAQGRPLIEFHITYSGKILYIPSGSYIGQLERNIFNFDSEEGLK